EATPGRYSIEVGPLARAQSLVSSGRASLDESVGSGGQITLSLGNGAGEASATTQIDIAEGEASLNGIRDAINAADIGVSASIINDGTDTPYRLVLSSAATGTDSQITVSVSGEAGGATPLADLLSYDSNAAD